jgi:uncharacterized membrane protein YbhN (UPF0104 family)
VFVLRGVDLDAVAAEFRRADLLRLLVPSLPAYVAVIWLRGIRWRHLTNAIRPLPRLALCRATAIGFLANNVLPLRVGELIRSYVLAREHRIAPAAVIGTVVIERVIDSWMVLCLGLGALWLAGDAGGSWRRGLLGLLPLAALPLAGLVWWRLAPAQVRGLVAWALRPLPETTARFALAQFDRVGEGLGALRGGSHLFWIAVQTLAIWLVANTVPVLAGFWSLGLEFPTRLDTWVAGWVTLAAVAIAVALPSAPGFFGVYHSACRLVLERFGFPAETAVAAGTLMHAVFWLTTCALGLVALRGVRARLGELGREAEATGEASRP